MALGLVVCGGAQAAAPPAPATVRLSADNPQIAPVTLTIPGAFLDPRWPGAGEAKDNVWAVALQIAPRDAACAAMPACRDLTARTPAGQTLRVGLRVAPRGWIGDMLSSRKATGYFIYGLQIFDEGLSRGAPARLQLSNLGQPAAIGEPWSPVLPPLTVIKCIDTASQISLCEVEVEVADGLIATSELPTVDLGRWPQRAQTLRAFVQTMLVAR